MLANERFARPGRHAYGLPIQLKHGTARFGKDGQLLEPLQTQSLLKLMGVPFHVACVGCIGQLPQILAVVAERPGLIAEPFEGLSHVVGELGIRVQSIGFEEDVDRFVEAPFAIGSDPFFEQEDSAGFGYRFWLSEARRTLAGGFACFGLRARLRG